MDLTPVVTGVLGYHGGMLADRVRTDSFRRAIAEVVRPGDVVVDLGAGTGILSLFACEAGAARVYAIESGAVIGHAREICAANGVEDRVTLINASSYEVTLPEQANVLVTETLWHFGLGEGIVGAVADARSRLLRPDARIVPRAVTLIVAPIESERAYAPIARWSENDYGVDLVALRRHAVNETHHADVDASELLSQPCSMTQIDLEVENERELDSEVAFEAARDGTLHGLAGWFSATLSDSVDLTNGPVRRTPSWAHVLFPLEWPLHIRAGDRMVWRLQTTANGTAWRWRTTVQRGEPDASGEVVSYDQCTLWAAPAPTGKLSADVLPARG